ncbi:MAG: aminomethyltransferase family protein, partial [Chloroflexota bacterium]
NVLEKVTEEDVSNEAFPFMRAAELIIRGTKVLAQRISYVGELGWEIYIQPERAVQVWDDLIEAGEEFGIEVGGYKALDSLRIEKGYKYFTSDITPREDPYSAGLAFCVKLNQGDFIGRQALQAIKSTGISKKLCTLVLDGEDYLPIYGGEAVSMNGEVISRLRSCGYGFTINRNIGFAFLPLSLATTGTNLEIEIFDSHHNAQVMPDILVDPKGENLKK